MQLDKIIIRLRQRSAWEAMDLGVMLMRRLWPVLLLPWLIMMSFVLVFVLFTEINGFVYIGSFIMWLSKPIYESMILYVLSRGVFGDYQSTSSVYSSMGKWIKTGLLTTVFFWRFSPSRSFNMAVHQLEGLSGNKRKQRLRILHNVKGSHSSWLTVIGVFFEYIFTLTLYVLVFYIAPDTSVEYINDLVDNPEDPLVWIVMGSIIYAITLFVLEPFYVASGFVLYLNRRTQLEGWDIELDFKKIAQRIQSQYHKPSVIPSSHNDFKK